MNDQETHGKVENIKGRVKEAAGILSGDKSLENEGSQQRVDGSVEHNVGKARRKIGEAFEDVGKAIKH